MYSLLKKELNLSESPQIQEISKGISGNFLFKQEANNKLSIELENKNETFESLLDQQEKLEDRFEFFEFMRDEKQFGKKRDKIKNYKSFKEENEVLIRNLSEKEKVTVRLVKEQAKNIEFLNSLNGKLSVESDSNKNEEDNKSNWFKKLEVSKICEKLRYTFSTIENELGELIVNDVLTGKSTVEEVKVQYLNN